jgi:hypothetical protein
MQWIRQGRKVAITEHPTITRKVGVVQDIVIEAIRRQDVAAVIAGQILSKMDCSR